MTVLQWRTLAERPLERGVVVTMGVFDGLHRGHRALLERVIAHGGGAPAVLSFDPLPASVLFGASARLILSRTQKERHLRRLGVRYLIVVDFSHRFSKLTGEQFVSQLLRRAAVRGVVVGQDFRCGRHRDTDAGILRGLLHRHGVEMEVVDLIRERRAKVSSSGIRQAIERGDVAAVRSLLGRDYELDVERVTPDRTGDGAVFPASSLTQLLPGPGRYSGAVCGRSGRSAARITVQPDRVVVRGPTDAATGIRFGRKEA